MVFDAAGGVVNLLSGYVPITRSVGEEVFDAADGVAISAGKKVFPPKFEPTPTSKQSSAVGCPVSPFGGHCCPGISRPVPADGGSSSVGSGFILPSSFFFIPSFFFSILYAHVYRTAFRNSANGSYSTVLYQLE